MIVFFVVFLGKFHISQQTCPGYLNEPSQNPTGTTTCVFSFQSQYCDSCCTNSSVCCDNGACMPYDPYCRYPTSCCQEPLCGQRCCSPSHGTPCGQICAPKDSLVCCDANTGSTCPVGKTCCGSNCCDANSNCCGGKCCGSGQVCTYNNKCCDQSSYCNGACCPFGDTCQNSICCPQGTSACGSNRCCNSAQTCSLGHCCSTGSSWCEAAAQCCDQGTQCLDGTCCSSRNVCGSSCCTTGQVCESNVCVNCPLSKQCGSACCQDGKECINGTCQFPCPSPCGSTCCRAGEYCNEGHCCTNGTVWCSTANACCNQQGEKCSPSGCCSNKHYCQGYCCLNGQYCDANHCSTCPPSEFCGDSCCNATQGELCCGSSCCTQGESCCGTTCCAKGKACCGSTCCAQGQVCNNGACQNECPNQCANGICCNDQEECCEATCCLKGQVCQNAACKNPCSKPCGSDGKCCKTSECCRGGRCCPCGGWWHCDDGSSIHDSILQNKSAVEKYLEKSNTHSTNSQSQLQIKPEELPGPAGAMITPSSYQCYTSQVLQTDACSIFPCLNNISNCGPNSYLMEMNEIYCTNVALFQSQFNNKGQEFLNCATSCIAQKHYQAYGQGVTPCCYSVEIWGSGDQQKTCYTKTCDYCSVYMTNTFAFTELFNNTAIVPFELYFQYCNVGE